MMTPFGSPAPANRPKASRREAVEPGLVGVQVRFLEVIGDRILMFEALKKDLAAQRKPAQTLNKIAELAHMTAGVAATLGYPHAGQLAADLEQAVRDGTAAGVPALRTWEQVSPRLELFLDELERLLDE